MPQGISAELIADKWGITREDMDAFGARSQQRAAAGDRARAASSARSSRCSTPTAALMTVDEGIRETTLESLAKLKPAFPRGGGRPGHRRQLVADHRRRRRPC